MRIVVILVIVLSGFGSQISQGQALGTQCGLNPNTGVVTINPATGVIFWDINLGY